MNLNEKKLIVNKIYEISKNDILEDFEKLKNLKCENIKLIPNILAKEILRKLLLNEKK